MHFIRKRDLDIRRRAQYICQRALYIFIRKGVLDIHKRGISSSTKEPQSSAKQPYAFHPQKSLVYPQKSPIYLPKSPRCIYPQKSLRYLQKKPTHVHVQRSSLYPQKRPIYAKEPCVSLKEPCICADDTSCDDNWRKRAQYNRERALCVQKRALYICRWYILWSRVTQKSPTKLQNSPVCPKKSPTHLQMIHPVVAIDATDQIYNRKRAYDVIDVWWYDVNDTWTCDVTCNDHNLCETFVT